MDKKRLFKGLLTVAAFELLVMPFTFLLRILFSRTLGVEDYGLFYAMINFVALISIFIDLGLGSSLAHYIPKLFHSEKYSLIKRSVIQVFLIHLLLSVIIISIILLLKNFLASQYFHTSAAILIIPLFTLLFLFNISYKIIVYFFIGVNNERFYASMNPIRLVLVLIASSIALVFFKENLLIAFSIIWVVSYLIISAIYSALAIINYPLVFRSAKTKESYFKPISKYASMVFLSATAFFILSRIDVFMLTIFKGVKMVGLYEAALPAASLTLLFMTPLRSYLFPTISKLKHLGDKKMISTILKAIYNLGLFLVLPLTIIFLFFAQDILSLAFGKEFILASMALKILIIGFFFKSFTLINFATLQGLGKVKKVALIVYIGVILNIILNTILIPKQLFGIKLFDLGIIGAALATSFCFLIMFILSLLIIHRNYAIAYKNWWKIIILNVFLFFGVYFLLKIIYLQVYVKMIIISLIVGAIYLLIGILWKVIDYNELIRLIRRDEIKI